MEELRVTKIIRAGNSLALIVPSNLLRAYGWKRGDRVIFSSLGNEALAVKRPSDVELKELKKITKDGDFSVKEDGSLIASIDV